MELIRRSKRDLWDPLDLFADFQDEMNRWFSSARRHRGDGASRFFDPNIDFTEDENQYLVKADLPGIRKEDVDISITGHMLTIKGERKEELEKKGKSFYHAERTFGSFQRTIELPTEVDMDQVKATYKDGVLELAIPKSEKTKPKQIKVEVK
jgi:HSP20 family protein